MNELFFKQSAEDFFSALLLGNGRMGVTVYGGVEEDVYALNDDTLWSGYPKEYGKDCSKAFERVRKLVAEDRILEAERVMVQEVSDGWSQCYLPAGNLVIRGRYGAAEHYRRSLSLERALHTVTFDGVRREAFVSFPDDVACIRYEGALPTLELTMNGLLKLTVSAEEGLLLLEG